MNSYLIVFQSLAGVLSIAKFEYFLKLKFFGANRALFWTLYQYCPVHISKSIYPQKLIVYESSPVKPIQDSFSSDIWS